MNYLTIKLCISSVLILSVSAEWKLNVFYPKKGATTPRSWTYDNLVVNLIEGKTKVNEDRFLYKAFFESHISSWRAKLNTSRPADAQDKYVWSHKPEFTDMTPKSGPKKGEYGHFRYVLILIDNKCSVQLKVILKLPAIGTKKKADGKWTTSSTIRGTIAKIKVWLCDKFPNFEYQTKEKVTENAVSDTASSNGNDSGTCTDNAYDTDNMYCPSDTSSPSPSIKRLAEEIKIHSGDGTPKSASLAVNAEKHTEYDQIVLNSTASVLMKHEKCGKWYNLKDITAVDNIRPKESAKRNRLIGNDVWKSYYDKIDAIGSVSDEWWIDYPIVQRRVKDINLVIDDPSDETVGAFQIRKGYVRNLWHTQIRDC